MTPNLYQRAKRSVKGIALAGLTGLAGIIGCGLGKPTPIDVYQGNFRGNDVTLVKERFHRAIIIQNKLPQGEYRREISAVDWDGNGSFETINFDWYSPSEVNTLKKEGGVDLSKVHPLAQYANSDSLNLVWNEVLSQRGPQ